MARLVQSENAQWSAAPPEIVGREKLQLKNGKVDFELANGVLLSLQGPAELELLSPRKLRLQSGKISVRVPPQAVGFTVSTPASRVVDLGTEFAVSVEPTGVRVIRGEVEPVSQAGAIPGNRAGTGSGKSNEGKWNLRAGDFKWIDELGVGHD